VRGRAGRDVLPDYPFEIFRKIPLGAHHQGFLPAQAVLTGESLRLEGRHLRQFCPHFLLPGFGHLDRRHRRIGDAGAFKFPPHGDRLVFRRIPEPRVQDDRLSPGQIGGLACDFVSDGVPHVPDGVHVFDLDLGVELVGSPGP